MTLNSKCPYLFILFFFFIPVLPGFGVEKTIIVENGKFRYIVSESGENISFIDKQSGKDYLRSDSVTYCASVKKSGKVYPVSFVRKTAGSITLDFKGADVRAKLKVEVFEGHVLYEVQSVSGTPESLVFMNIPLTLEAVPDEPFAACVLSLNLFTHVEQLPALQDHLWASCYPRFGLKGAKIAVLGVPQQEMLPMIRTVMKSAKDIPFSDKGGAWAQMNKEGYGSYLMDMGTLTEQTVDEWIAKCDSLGFNQIAIHGAHHFFKNGDLELHKDKWPGGWADFKRINARLHKAGISSILLTYAYFIDKTSRYVTPVPSKDLGFLNAFTLVGSLEADATEIEVKESTADVSTIVGYFFQNSVTLRIGEELVEFSGVTKSPPYKFTGVKRGVNGTMASAHKSGEKGYHLQQMFGLFTAGPETKLFNEIAEKTARITNENDFDGIYFDAIDGNNMLGGKENAWYYGSKFIFEVARHLKPMVGMEMCDMPHHYWHYSSRWQAWDKAVRGYKRFVDVHVAALKSNDHRHGEWIGHTGSINRLAPAKNGRLMLPLHMGWWGNSTWESPQVEMTFPDDMEYLLAKMIGNDAGLSMLAGIDEKTLNENPIFRKLARLTRQYENLRHNGYFSEAVKEQLRKPGEEFTLIQTGDDQWDFKPVQYTKHKSGENKEEWIVKNKFESQPVRLRIFPQMAVKGFDDPENVVLADFKAPGEFQNRGSAKGVSGEIKVLQEKIADGTAGAFSVSSKGESIQEGTWIKMEKKFEPCLDLSKRQGLGVWVKGDGSGALINFRTESPKHLSMGGRGDHFVKLDFEGWKYFELVEIESSAFNDYLWPDEYHNVYNSYYYKVEFKCVDKLQIWANNLPAGKEITAYIGSVKALPLVNEAIENPSVTIGGSTITFPVRMEPGMYLEFNSMQDCKLYGSKGEWLGDVEPRGNSPELLKGNNRITFECNSSGTVKPRVEVTVISEGKPLTSD